MTLRYFQGVRTPAEIKQRYDELSKQYHPDRGGTGREMAEINQELSMLKAVMEYHGGMLPATTGGNLPAQPSVHQNITFNVHNWPSRGLDLNRVGSMIDLGKQLLGLGKEAVSIGKPIVKGIRDWWDSIPDIPDEEEEEG